MRGNLQKIMIGIVVVIVLAFILFSGDSLVKLVDTIKQGTPAFIIAAVAAQVGKYLAQGRGFQACFNTVNGHISYGTGLSLVFGTFFMNTVAPSMNLAGTSLVMATATKNGMQAGKGTTAALLMQLSIDTGFVIIMLVTFGALSFTVGLQPGWLAVGAVAIALVGGLVFMITVGGLKPNLVLKVLHPFVKLADKVLAHFKKPPVDDAVTRTIHNFSDAAHLITKNPRKTVQSFLWTTLSSVCEMGCFVLVGFAFGVHHPEALICGYVVATLFAMISFVPQGVGVVEAAVTVAFALFGVGSGCGHGVPRHRVLAAVLGGRLRHPAYEGLRAQQEKDRRRHGPGSELGGLRPGGGFGRGFGSFRSGARRHLDHVDGGRARGCGRQARGCGRQARGRDRLAGGGVVGCGRRAEGRNALGEGA